MKEKREIVFRPITLFSELQAVVELQKTAWAPETITSASQMIAANLHGGTVIGAFDGSQTVGFCYGFPGYNGRESFLASHMMAIDCDYRDSGIGMRLKLEQRKWAMQYGYSKIVWTYDPFETRNAYLNLCKLGGVVSKYIDAFYGEDNLGLPTDRFVVEWDLRSERVRDSIANPVSERAVWRDYPELLEYEQNGETVRAIGSREIGHSPGYLISVPSGIELMKTQQLDDVKIWKSRLRDLCRDAFSRSYRIVGIIRNKGPVHNYVLEAGK